MTQFKGRVVAYNGDLIIMDTKPHDITRREGAATMVIGSAWKNTDLPRINSVIRCNFHAGDKR